MDDSTSPRVRERGSGVAQTSTKATPGPENPLRGVLARQCAACLGRVVRRGARGPFPRYCERCREWLRDRQRLGSYLRWALSAANKLGLESVAALASQALVALDGEAWRL